MSSQIIPIHRTNTNSSSNTHKNSTCSTNNKHDIWFNAFDFAPGQDENIRWLSRPNQQLMNEKCSQDAEKFRITFDVENFKPEQIKIYIEHRKLTISGVYEEHSEGHYMQKQFEKTFDLPSNADVDSMASFITACHMLVVEIPLNASSSSSQIDHLNTTKSFNDQRRQSFSLNKYNTSNNQSLLSKSNDLSNLLTSNDSSNLLRSNDLSNLLTSNDLSNLLTSNDLSTPDQQIRRTSITKTTTTRTSGSSGLPDEAAELLRNAERSTGSTSIYSTHTTERHSSNTDNQQIPINESNTSSSSTNTKETKLTSSGLANLPMEIPQELLANGGTITIQKRKVSMTKETNENSGDSVSVPITRSNDIRSTSSTNTNTTNNTSSNTLDQQQSINCERCDLKTVSNNNERRMFTLEEFLQNKTWNPSLIDGPHGKKILYMRLQMKAGTTKEQMKISLNGYDFRVEVDNEVTTHCGRYISQHSYRQVTLFSTCEVDQLKTEFKDDGFLHIQVPINL